MISIGDICKDSENSDYRTTEMRKKKYMSVREYLTGIFLTEVKEQKLSLAWLSRETNVSKRTFQHMKQGKLSSLSILIYLFSKPVVAAMLSPKDAFWVTDQVIGESLRCGERYPVFRLVKVSEEELYGTMPSLPEYMRSLRVKHLNISVREACRRFEHCTTRQVANIEKECKGVGIGPVCNLFDHYHREIYGLPDTEWGTFATLVFRILFPRIKEHMLEFVGWRE